MGQEDGEYKEVYAEGEEDIQYMEVFSMSRAARYVGKADLTFKRWVSEKLLPPPCLFCTQRGYKHYSLGEMQTIARVLTRHFSQYDYLHGTHYVTVNELWQSVEGYRKENY